MNPLAIALQGIGYGALLVAVQGFAPVPQTATAAPEPPKYYSASLDAMQALRRQQLEEDEVILAIVKQFVMET